MANESDLCAAASQQALPFPRELYFASYHNEWIAYTPSGILAHGTDKATVEAEAVETGIWPYSMVFCKFTPGRVS